jgi:hypothetical protein
VHSGMRSSLCMTHKAHIKIEVSIAFPIGVESSFWTSIFCSWACKRDLKASICRPLLGLL